MIYLININDDYVYKGRGQTLFITSNIKEAKIFKSEKEANKYMEKYDVYFKIECLEEVLEK